MASMCAYTHTHTPIYCGHAHTYTYIRTHGNRFVEDDYNTKSLNLNKEKLTRNYTLSLLASGNQ